MADLKHYKVTFDPAMERLNHMTKNRYLYFRWTPRTAWISFMFIAVVPASIATLGYAYDGKWDLRAKRRGDSILEW